ncbi:hypothetical protein SAMN04487906_0644 [Zhouia amylolytica]|uniref:Periplasmic nitrate reductase chaperone NapD n=1 Tax=Zhouia amylolytica TaxID=376730 RepID=A0A1I6QGU8_9FLAO|nr:hypothetical protein [Zhouia amylolytica]SFS51518.1 hypothetical protein SAMN04487906_0644 [Zhouia amylolytica]
MPIISYLAHPYKGKKDNLVQEISRVKGCEVIPAQNEELLIVVTETSSKQEEEILKAKLDAIPSMKLLTMVSGFETPID